MTTPIVAEKKRHPQNIRITDALEDDKARQKAQKGIISKQATLITAGLSDGELQKIVGETMEPNPEQLERINKFTRKAVGPSDVVCFTTLSCNDIVDRDDDQFTTQCVKDFAELPQPLSPIGKSFMLDHDYSVGNAMGRIFGASIEKVSTEQGSATFLMNEVYLPNTEQFQPLIEKIDFGIAWAVSVGVMLGKDGCTVCGEGFSSFGYWCRNGHDKGLYYDPNSEETDAWGWPEPCSPDQSNAVKCVRQFMEPRDFYELSQVFLGAQYYAALEDKAPEMAGLLKGASNSFINASAEEARKLPLRHEPEKVSEARVKYAIEEADDGAMVWKDENDLVWTFDPEDPEADVLCLGKSNTTKSEEDDEDGSTARGSGTDEQFDPEDQGGGGNPDDAADSTDDQSEEDGASELSGEGSASSVDDDEDDETEEAETSDDTEEEKALSKDAVLAAVKAAALDEGLVKAVQDGEGNGLNALLLAVQAENKSLREEKEALAQKATLGDAYLKELRAEAIDWYVKSHVSGDNHAVKTETFEKMLDRFGDDVDLFRSVIEENKDLAKAKFPQAVRRSSFPTDPNEKEALDEPTFQKENDEKVRKIHG